jgi:16S rRNA (guanine527-N7)-methyltransferase
MTSSDSTSDSINVEPGSLLNSDELRDSLNRYLDLLQAENAKVNLVSRETSRDDLMRLALQSLVPLAVDLTREILTAAKTALDIGSGGGFPAVPLSLAFPNLSFTLCERRQKKARALERIIRGLKLDATVLAEDFDHHEFDTPFDIITLRYVTLTQKTLSRARSAIADGGAILYYGLTEPGFDLADWHGHRWCYTLTDTAEPQHLTVLHRFS